jgi:hypothetical protein
MGTGRILTQFATSFATSTGEKMRISLSSGRLKSFSAEAPVLRHIALRGVARGAFPGWLGRFGAKCGLGLCGSDDGLWLARELDSCKGGVD